MAYTPPVPVKSQAVRNRVNLLAKDQLTSDYVEMPEVDRSVGLYESLPEGHHNSLSLPRPAKRKLPPPVPVSVVQAPLAATRKQPESPRLPREAARKDTFLSAGMTLPQFVEQFSEQLPLRIKVLNGYFGDSARETISTDDTYNVHFVKHCEVVVIKDMHNQLYSVPINSSFEFGLVFDSENKTRKESAMTGCTFEKVSEITALQHRPHVVCAQTSWSSDDGNTSLSSNEVLIIKQVQKSRFKGKKGLKVYSVTQKKEKVLPEDCASKFSTHPHYNRVHISDLVEQLKDPFPCEAIVFPNAELYQNQATSQKVQDLPSSLVTQVVDVQKHVTETSLIVSAVLSPGFVPDDPEYDPKALIDIPLDSVLSKVIDIAVLEWKDVSETEKVYDDTRSIYEKFNRKKVTAARVGGSDRVYMAQTLFYTALKPGCEALGLRLETPSRIYEKLPLVLPKSAPPPATPPREKKTGSLHQQRLSSTSSKDEGTTEPPGYDFVHPGSPRGRNKTSPVRHTTTPGSPSRSAPASPLALPPSHSSPSPNSSGSGVFTPGQPKPTADREYESISNLIQSSPALAIAKSAPNSNREYDQINYSEMKRPPAPLPGQQNPVQSSRQYRPVGKPAAVAEPTTLYYETTDMNGQSLVPQPVQYSAPDTKHDGLETRFKELEKRLLLIEVHYRHNRNNSQEIESLKKSTSKLTRQLKDLEGCVETLIQRPDSVTGNGSPMHQHQPQRLSKEEQESFETANKKFLEKLNVLEVQNVLEAMDLRQYQEPFSREHLNGELLLEVDDTVLQTELGISSKLHRLRLMKLVNGQYSAESLLSGADPYGTFTK